MRIKHPTGDPLIVERGVAADLGNCFVELARLEGWQQDFVRAFASVIAGHMSNRFFVTEASPNHITIRSIARWVTIDKLKRLGDRLEGEVEVAPIGELIFDFRYYHYMHSSQEIADPRWVEGLREVPATQGVVGYARFISEDDDE